MDFDIEEYCLSNLDRAKKGKTNQISAVCPWCEKYGSFYVSVKSGDYICFKCESKGKMLVGLVAKIENISWYQAKAFLLKKLLKRKRKYTIPSLEQRIRNLRELENENEEIEKIYPLPKEFIPIYQNGKWKYPKYLKDRKIKKETAKKWGLGFCNRGRYKNRIIIPLICDNGVSFTSRSVKPEIQPKYLNPVCDFQKDILGGWNLFDKNSDFVLVEGPFDAIKMHQHGFNVLFLGGKTLSQKQKELFYTISRNVSVTIMLDPEEISAPLDVAKELFFIFEGKVYIAELKNGIDPGSSTLQQAFKAYDNSVRYKGNEKLSIFRKRIEKI
jgi:DNA primase